jgi:glycosyltransferase involved in cell wall biosynthesis
MRVLFLTPWYPEPDHIYRGIFVREHAKAVRAAGNEVVVLHLAGKSHRGRGLWRMARELDASLTEGIATHRVERRSLPIPGTAGLVSLWSAVRASRALRASGFRPDLIHASFYYGGISGYVAGKALRLPVVITEHSTAFPLRELGRGMAAAVRFVMGRVAAVMPVCVFLQRAIEDYGVRARFRVVPNAVDTAIFHPAPGRSRRSGPWRLLFVGNLEPTEHKGFPTVVEALIGLAERRQDWQLDVIGEGPSKGRYEESVAASPIAKSVTFHGAVPKPRVAEMMRASDLFVMPSRFENLPCVIIEAMASGLPVVSTTVGGIPEMVTRADGILVPPDDPAALADALDRVMSNPQAFDGTVIAARAAARYGLDSVGAQIQAVYDEILPRPGS